LNRRLKELRKACYTKIKVKKIKKRKTFTKNIKKDKKIVFKKTKNMKKNKVEIK